MSISSPNMGMPLPVPGVDTGPTYATLISGYSNVSTTSCLQILDSHDHSTGKGIPIGPSGLNINADLPLNGNNLNTVRAVRFSAQTPAISAVNPDIGCAYFSGVDLYVNDFSGNQIRITQSGGVAGSPGSITGLVSPATVTYSGGTYVFQSAANTAANLDAESIILRNAAVNSKGLTLNPPSSMATNYSITMPAITSSATSFLAIDLNGNITEPYPTANGLTRNNLAAVGQKTSASSGNYQITSATPAVVSSVSITTTGRPVILLLQSDGDPSGSYIGFQASVPPYNGSGQIILKNNSVSIALHTLENFTSGSPSFVTRPATLTHLDPATPGTYTYSLYAASDGSNTVFVKNVVLVAYEL